MSVGSVTVQSPSPVRHPAAFSDPILEAIRPLIPSFSRVLDPFAGIGRVHELSDVSGVQTFGVELEPEWAHVHPRTIVGNALSLPFPDRSFDVVCTSPCYGNRLADSHNAQEVCSFCDDGVVIVAGGLDICAKCGGQGHREYRRITYRHTLGRALHPDNAGQLQWGKRYREFHERAWAEAVRVLDNLFILNVSDHVRGGEVMPVTDWHLMTLNNLGLHCEKIIHVETKRMRLGANRNARVDHETVAVLVK